MIWASRTFSMLGCTVLITETEHPEQFENCSQRSGNSFTAASSASAMLFGIDSTRAKPAPVAPAHSMNSRRLTDGIAAPPADRRHRRERVRPVQPSRLPLPRSSRQWISRTGSHCGSSATAGLTVSILVGRSEDFGLNESLIEEISLAAGVDGVGVGRQRREPRILHRAAHGEVIEIAKG